MAEPLFLLVPAGSVLALVFAFVQARRALAFPEGGAVMKKISLAVRQGANAYLKRQYTGAALFFAVMFVVLSALAFAGFLTPFVPFAFITGGFSPGFQALSE
jgi:K(+)-stimulated pyrophosphate-energized sodium pump